MLLAPEEDSILKVAIREAFGVNAMLSLCEVEADGQLDCFHKGHQVGTTEILYSDQLHKGQQYALVIDYSHSVIAFHSFSTCPHLPVEISMISHGENEFLAQRREEEQVSTDKESKQKLKELFERMDGR